jgi:hypothetical protein
MQVSYFEALRNGHGQPESFCVGGHMVNPSGAGNVQAWPLLNGPRRPSLASIPAS